MIIEKEKIAIIGGGVSGLIAALVLENHGFSPLLFEKTERVGGRVKTDIMDGYQLDHGFQVLLDAYPMAQKYLDYEALDLAKFLPGACIFKNGSKKVIGDPLRNLSLLIPTLTSGIGTLSDKFRILKLNTELKKKSISDIFDEPEISTLEYLRNRGFSNEIIADFFKPFFTGIFLETELETSSRMFDFVYKMFGTGHAMLPISGIGAIPNQLASKLKRTKIHFNATLENCEDGKLNFTGGTTKHADYVILATESSDFLKNMRNQEVNWKSCQTLYFTAPKNKDNRPLIGLVPDEKTLINNIFFHKTLPTEKSGPDELLSVTVVKSHNLSESELIAQVKKELAEECAISGLKYLKTYYINKALPKLKSVAGDISPSETRLTDTVFLAGDYLLNGSLNAAMLSGEKAALGIIEIINKTITK
jgi:protoporphyrinogen oxidase